MSYEPLWFPQSWNNLVVLTSWCMAEWLFFFDCVLCSVDLFIPCMVLHMKFLEYPFPFNILGGSFSSFFLSSAVLQWYFALESKVRMHDFCGYLDDCWGSLVFSSYVGLLFTVASKVVLTFLFTNTPRNVSFWWTTVWFTTELVINASF